MMSEVRIPLKENDCNVKKEDRKLEKKCDVHIDDHDNGKDAAYFRELLSNTKIQLTEKCECWNTILQNSITIISENVQGDIRTVIGQAQLVMKERGNQFNGLIDNHEFGTSEKKINPSDLQGFWDMIYFQVEDVLKKFEDLTILKQNNWVKEETLKPKVVKKTVRKPKAVVAKSSAKSEALKAQRAAARKRLAAARAVMKGEMKEQVSTFDAGFFKIESPVKENIGKPRRSTAVESPLVRSSKKPVTPSSANFMHGRVIRSRLSTATSSSDVTKEGSPAKKTKLDFDDDEKEILSTDAKIGSHDGGMLSPQGLTSTKLTGNKNTSFTIASSTTALPSDFSPVSCLTSSHSFEARTVATETDFSDVDDDRFEKLNENMRLGFQSVTEKLKDLIQSGLNSQSESLQQVSTDEVQILRDENARLKSELAQVLKNADHPYEEHYHRSRTEVQILEAQLSQHHKLIERIPQIQSNFCRNLQAIEEKCRVLKDKNDYLNKFEKELNERSKIENQELTQLRMSCAEYESQKTQIEAILSENHDLRKDSENAAYKIQHRDNEIDELMKTCQLYEMERDQLAKNLCEKEQMNCDIQHEIESMKNQIEFERDEQAVDKQFKDTEMERLKSIIENQDSLKESNNARLSKLQSKCHDMEKHNSQLKATVEELRLEKNNLQNQLINRTDAYNQLKENHDNHLVEFEAISTNFLKQLTNFHADLIQIRIEQSRRSLDFLNNADDSIVDDDCDVTLKENNFEKSVLGDDASQLHDNVVEYKLNKANDYMMRIIDIHGKIHTKNENDQLKLRCDFRAMRDKMNSYEERDCIQQSTSSNAVAVREELISKLTQERDDYQNKYQSLERKFSQVFMARNNGDIPH